MAFKIREVANGNSDSAIFDIEGDSGYYYQDFSRVKLGLAEDSKFPEIKEALKPYTENILSEVMDYLLANYPYEMYWVDNTVNPTISWLTSYMSSKDAYRIERITITLYVSSDYSIDNVIGTTYVDKELTSTTKNAALYASTLADNATGTDVDKVTSFKNEICRLVSYNHNAADDETTPYGNPWQMIYVFDQDPTTNVVCEGYAKAFKYLCDVAGITCYTVTGTMDGGTGAGPHMWNIVTIDGRNYLVDVTNCDGDESECSIGYPDQLFLANMDGSVNAGYSKTINDETISYYYDNETQSLYGNNIDF